MPLRHGDAFLDGCRGAHDYDISFCAHLDPTPAAPTSWGRVKAVYR